MQIDWKQLTRAAGFKPEDGGEITVVLRGGRKHRVTVEPCEDQDLIRVWGVAGRRADLNSLREDSNIVAWTRNRHSELVGFKIDSRGRMIGEAWVPTAGLEADEWGLWVRAVAQSCDHIEYLLTGKDEDGSSRM